MTQSKPLVGKQADRLVGKKVIVTAGGTREAIDPVRFIGNRSSGKQGYAIAEEAKQRGADVILVATTVRDLSKGIDRILVESAAEMRDAVVLSAAEADIVIMAAAVADFRPSSAKLTKHKKSEGLPAITLEPTADILAELGSKKTASQVLVGFAAESDSLEANASRKLFEKGADIIVANDIVAPNAGFDSDTNEVIIFTRSHVTEDAVDRLHVLPASKREVAAVLLDVVEECLAAIR